MPALPRVHLNAFHCTLSQPDDLSDADEDSVADHDPGLAGGSAGGLRASLRRAALVRTSLSTSAGLATGRATAAATDSTVGGAASLRGSLDIVRTRIVELDDDSDSDDSDEALLLKYGIH